VIVMGSATGVGCSSFSGFASRFMIVMGSATAMVYLMFDNVAEV